MGDSDILQGGQVSVIRNYYDNVISFMPKTPLVCLNVGSGIVLEFERFLHKKRNGIDSIDCVDQYAPLPSSEEKVYREFFVQNLETPFQMPGVYDAVFCFEVIEHVDETDVLLENCYNHLKEGGLFMIAIPNLSSFYARTELLLGYQPHVLEVSNRKADFGTGVFGRRNNPHNKPLHHIRGFTFTAMKEMLEFYNFEIIKIIGDTKGLFVLRLLPPSLASVVLFVCKKRCT